MKTRNADSHVSVGKNGNVGGGPLNHCWLYDLATGKWEAMPPLITARWYHRSVSLGDSVYAVGGETVGDNNVLA